MHNFGRGLDLKLAVLLVAVMAISLPCRIASAGSEEADAHYRKGATEYELGHFDEAIREFEDAFRLSPDPNLLYNIAQSYRQQGNAEKALFFYRRFLKTSPESPMRPKIEARVRELEQMAEQQKAKKETAPLQTEAPKTVTSSEIKPTEPSSSANAVVKLQDPVVPPPRDTENRAEHRGVKVAAFTLAGLGLASLAVGVGFGLKARSDGNDVANAPVFDPSVERDGKRAETLQGVFLGAGGALAATGAVIAYFAFSRSEAHASRVALTPFATDTAWGASCRAQF